jgi:hypothetical protein
MKRKGEVLLSMKQFSREIGAPDAFVADISGQQIFKVKTFCNEIGSMLRALEKGTAKFYIGLLKEAVRKDMKDQDSPMVSWDYCIARRATIHNLTAKYNFKLHDSNQFTLTHAEETFPTFVNFDGTNRAKVFDELIERRKERPSIYRGL